MDLNSTWIGARGSSATVVRRATSTPLAEIPKEEEYKEAKTSVQNLTSYLVEANAIVSGKFFVKVSTELTIDIPLLADRVTGASVIFLDLSFVQSQYGLFEERSDDHHPTLFSYTVDVSSFMRDVQQSWFSQPSARFDYVNGNSYVTGGFRAIGRAVNSIFLPKVKVTLVVEWLNPNYANQIAINNGANGWWQYAVDVVGTTVSGYWDYLDGGSVSREAL